MKHLTQNKTVIDWIEEKKALVSPDEVMWIDGSEEQLDALRAGVFSFRCRALLLPRFRCGFCPKCHTADRQ